MAKLFTLIDNSLPECHNKLVNEYMFGDPEFPQRMRWLLPFTLLDLVLKGFALWKSAKKDQSAWFIALLIVNSLGILPGIYLLLNRGQQVVKPAKRKK